MTTSSWRVLQGPAGDLHLHTTGPPDAGNLVVLCHELPRAPGAAADIGRTAPALAERLNAETGWRVLAPNLRGAGGSRGDFSAAGWLEDLAFVLQEEMGPADLVALAGFGLGGALALRTAVAEPRVRAVATVAAPADLTGWVARPQELLAICRSTGAVSLSGYPPDLARWADELVALDPLGAVADLGSRSLLVMHGLDDPDIAAQAARDLAAAAVRRADLRLLSGAGHWLRADPRVVATLIGWLERQR